MVTPQSFQGKTWRNNYICTRSYQTYVLLGANITLHFGLARNFLSIKSHIEVKCPHLLLLILATIKCRLSALWKIQGCRLAAWEGWDPVICSFFSFIYSKTMIISLSHWGTKRLIILTSKLTSIHLPHMHKCKHSSASDWRNCSSASQTFTFLQQDKKLRIKHTQSLKLILKEGYFNLCVLHCLNTS